MSEKRCRICGGKKHEPLMYGVQLVAGPDSPLPSGWRTVEELEQLGIVVAVRSHPYEPVDA